MTVKNKHNKKMYKVLEVKEKTVILEREDGINFEINKSEFNFFYVAEKGE